VGVALSIAGRSFRCLPARSLFPLLPCILRLDQIHCAISKFQPINIISLGTLGNVAVLFVGVSAPAAVLPGEITAFVMAIGKPAQNGLQGQLAWSAIISQLWSAPTCPLFGGKSIRLVLDLSCAARQTAPFNPTPALPPISGNVVIPIGYSAINIAQKAASRP
jgi:hypothetical protein